MTAPPPSLTLLDEELALLVPEAGPLPWLSGLSPAEQDAVLCSAGRGLHVRGAVQAADGRLQWAGEQERLLAPLAGPGRRVEVLAAVEGGPEPDLLVLRPLPGGEVLVHATSPDGVHLLTLLDPDSAQEQLLAVLDPHGPEARGAAVARVRVLAPSGEADEQVCVSAGGAVGRTCPGPDGLPAQEVEPLTEPALRAWVEELLATPRAAAG